MFRLISSGPEAHDCTMPYDVIFSGEKPTVGDFIKEVLEKHPNDWGTIKIWTEEDKCWGKTICFYRRGSTESHPEEDILSRKINKATAHGGWSLMDYLLWLEDISENKETGGDDAR